MTRSPGFKVFMASALGAFIGSLIGVQLTHLFWWVGMLVGGIVGYVGYDAKSALLSIPVAYRQTRYLLARLWTEVVSEGRKLAKFGLAALMVISGLIVLGLSWTAPCAIAVNIATNHGVSFNSFALWFMNGEHNIWPVLVCTVLWNLLFGIVLAIGAVFVTHLIVSSDPSGQMTRRVMFLYTNPTAWLCYWLPKGLWFTGTFLAVFLWKLFRLVHSDRRLLCGLDAAIGATGGIYYHNPLIGALAGGLVSLIDYELVSKRWLKVVSA